VQKGKTLPGRIVDAFLRMFLISTRWDKYSPLQLAKRSEEKRIVEEEAQYGEQERNKGS
jgi:hypothetical protein